MFKDSIENLKGILRGGSFFPKVFPGKPLSNPLRILSESEGKRGSSLTHLSGGMNEDHGDDEEEEEYEEGDQADEYMSEQYSESEEHEDSMGFEYDDYRRGGEHEGD